MSLIIRHYLISGRVQGVGYRSFVANLATDLGLEGWVRNLRNGQVEALIGGLETAFPEFEQGLKDGPKNSKVDDIKAVVLNEPMSLGHFEIMEDGEEPWRKESFV